MPAAQDVILVTIEGGKTGELVWIDPVKDEVTKRIPIGHAPNALPQRARANINCRIFPGVTQETVAERLGWSRAHVANTIRLLSLPGDVQTLLVEQKIQAGHARALLGLPDDESRSTLALRAAAEGLSVRQVEEIVRNYVVRENSDTGTGRAVDPVMSEIEELLSEQLATRVMVMLGKRKGKIVVEFATKEDLDRIVSEIIGSGPGQAPE